MDRTRWKPRIWALLVLCASLWPCLPRAGAEMPKDRSELETQNTILPWRSLAKLHKTVGSEKGDLTISGDGIEFRSTKGLTTKWPFLEVQTFFLSPKRLVIETYQNRKQPLPGMERYRFDLTESVSPLVAAELANRVQRPSKNAIPILAPPGIVLPAHHRTNTGGTNGTLQFRNGGIDYVTTASGDSRSWRWADLQTLSNPDPYHLFVFGYRDTYTFDLKEPLPESLSRRITDALDADSVRDRVHSPDALDSRGTQESGQANSK